MEVLKDISTLQKVWPIFDADDVITKLITSEFHIFSAVIFNGPTSPIASGFSKLVELYPLFKLSLVAC